MHWTKDGRWIFILLFITYCGSAILNSKHVEDWKRQLSRVFLGRSLRRIESGTQVEKKRKKKSSIFSPRPLIPSGLWPGLVDCGQDLLCLQVIFIYISSTPVLVKKLEEISIIADKSKERRQACFLRILFSSSDILRIGIGIESLFNSSVDSKPPQPKTCHTMRLFVQIVPKY